MDKNKIFWLERWQREELGFHQIEVNSHLRKFWPGLNLADGTTVFVPLCGKSQDMQWLHDKGHKVLGVELSAIAVQAFFNENGYTPQHNIEGKFDRYEANAICILRGDFFDLNRDQMTKVNAVYDRASLIALPQEMREGYVRHLVSLLKPATRILLITVDYPQPEMEGPPFSVSSDEVEKLYRNYADAQLLAHQDVLAQNPRFQQRCLSRLVENIFLLTLR
jgi:thiopurine S-methyltransferase